MRCTNCDGKIDTRDEYIKIDFNGDGNYSYYHDLECLFADVRDKFEFAGGDDPTCDDYLEEGE